MRGVSVELIFPTGGIINFQCGPYLFCQKQKETNRQSPFNLDILFLSYFVRQKYFNVFPVLLSFFLRRRLGFSQKLPDKFLSRFTFNYWIFYNWFCHFLYPIRDLIIFLSARQHILTSLDKLSRAYKDPMHIGLFRVSDGFIGIITQGSLYPILR